MSKLKFLITLACFVYVCTTTMTSCKSTKNIPTVVSKQDSTITEIKGGSNSNLDSIKLVNETLDKISKNRLDYNTFSAKVKVDYEDGKNKVPDVIAYIRIKKDSIIWINVEKLLVNVFRIAITSDSIYIMNKIEKEITIRPLSYLQELAQVPFDFTTLENLLVGNPVYFRKPISGFKKNESTTTILCLTDIFKNLLTVNNTDFTIEHSKLDDVDAFRNRTCDLSYSDFEKTSSNQMFPKERSIVVSEKSKLEINLKFKQFKFDETLTYPFTIPKNYKYL